MEITLEIKKRNRDFGIITWPYSLDFEIKTMFELKDTINIEFGDKIFKSRKVSYKYRRISLGKKRIESLGKKKYFILTKNKDTIQISAK